MRALVNLAVQPAAVPVPSRDAAPFHASLDGYAPTPVRELPELADELGLGAVLVKDESHRLGLPAFKVLGAAWAIERALQEQPEASSLVAASAGNHGRAVAHIAAQRGLRCRVFLPARSVAARRDAIASEGAEVVVVDGSYEDAVAQAAAAGTDPEALLIADVGRAGPARWVIDGYATLFAEATAQATYDVILVPVGVGSLAAAAARHAAETARKVIGVEPVTAACLTAALAAGRPTAVSTPGTAMAGLDCAEVSHAAWSSLQAGIHGTITVHDAQARRAMRVLAAAGLAIGESGAAPLAALRTLMTDPECSELKELASVGPSTRVLLVATEGLTARAAPSPAGRMVPMPEGGLDAALDRLYAAPLDGFVAERTRLARELRSAGERSAAEQVAKLPKPSAAAWALNHVAREDSEAVAEWLAATAELRDASAHAAEVGGDALRAAMTAHREATARLLDVVREGARPGDRPLSEAMLDRVRTLLQSATIDERLAEHLRAGRVTEEKAPPDVLDPEPQGKRPAAKSPRRQGKRPATEPPRDRPKRDPKAAARAARKEDLERRAGAAREELLRLREEAARRTAAAQSADERLEDARRTFNRSKSEAAAARDAVRDAEKAAAAAERQLGRLDARLRKAGGSG